MLAAECAWTVLRAEHARMRELLSLIERELKSGDLKHSGSAAVRIARLIERLQDFDEATHRPKGVALVGVLRGRSAEADDLLARLERQRERCDELLSRAKAKLERAQSGDALAAAAVENLLAEHRRLLLDHLDKEDTLLHSHTALLLTREEWAAVVSSISKAMRARKG
ncbi:hemerythrin domain-containing protein [Variovorax sp. DT-64]|uniref:hemerythrin domain-containing protein n=1 Tax=Variovorax sp. DT-64 TaxID=3396160 RepID=UPI003F1AAFC1